MEIKVTVHTVTANGKTVVFQTAGAAAKAVEALKAFEIEAEQAKEKRTATI